MSEKSVKGRDAALRRPRPVQGRKDSESVATLHASRSAQRAAPTTLREDAPPYRVAADVSPRQISVAEKSAALSPTQPRFIDLFCGIGGFRYAFERAGCQCVFSSDWNEQARITYEANHGERPHGDIHTVAVADIPAHDILCAGFPCQPFSIAGVSKKLSLGKKHGFEDKEQGNLFFTLAGIINYHRPGLRFETKLRAVF